MSLSLWVPLSDVTTDNACMSVLPRSHETRYAPPLSDPAEINPDDGIPLPAKAGSVLGWSQDLYHWSGRMTSKAVSPRVSLSLEFQNPAFAPMAEPLLDIRTPPSFEDRLQLIADQIPKYQHMEPMAFRLNQTR